MDEELRQAVRNNNIQEVKEFLFNNPTIYPDNLNIYGEAPLFIACYEGFHEIAELLLNDGRVDIYKPNNFGVTPFDLVFKKGQVEIVKLLLKNKKIDFNKENKDGQTPLYVVSENGQTEIVKLLLDCERVNVNIAKRKVGKTPFSIACARRHIEIIKLYLLLDEERIDLNKVNQDEVTPFYTACRCGDLEVAKVLLNEKKIDINKGNKNGWIPISVACENGHIEIVEHLLASGRKVNLNVQTSGGRTPLGIARKREKDEKSEWENEEKFQERKRNCEKIVELLELFETNPKETRFKLRKKLGLADADAASVFMILVLLSDNYLSCKDS